jgi:hypothetical protein
MMTLPVSYLDDLHNYVCAVKFTKKDGSIRDMLCTLREDRLPAQTDIEENIQKKKPNADVVSVWDIENEGWRSFRKDSVTSFKKQLDL